MDYIVVSLIVFGTIAVLCMVPLILSAKTKHGWQQAQENPGWKEVGCAEYLDARRKTGPFGDNYRTVNANGKYYVHRYNTKPSKELNAIIKHEAKRKH